LEYGSVCPVNRLCWNPPFAVPIYAMLLTASQAMDVGETTATCVSRAEAHLTPQPAAFGITASPSRSAIRSCVPTKIRPIAGGPVRVLPMALTVCVAAAGVLMRTRPAVAVMAVAVILAYRLPSEPTRRLLD
jgi:hypothetical protein